MRLASALAEPPPGRPVMPELEEHSGLMQAVLDPYVNAAHVSLLRAKDDRPLATEQRLAELRRRLVLEGPEELERGEIMALLGDVDSMVTLHEEIWSAPAVRLAPWWQRALQYYQLVALPPQTAFTRAA